MTTKIETPDLLNAIAIGLGAEILKNNIKKDSKGSKELLDAFANTHPNFKPKTWETLVDWLTYYNHAQDYERLLGPVLAKLNQPEFNIVEELAKLFLNNQKKIAKVKQWSELTNWAGAEKLQEYISFLSQTEGKKQLKRFRTIFSNYTGKLDNESLVDFLQTNLEASGLVESLALISKAKITQPPQVKRLTDALNLNLILRGRAAKADDKINLQLNRLVFSNKWELNFEKTKALFTVKEKKLGNSSLIAVPAPGAEAVNTKKSAPGTSVKILDSEIDNPGLGNCAFYAFAIGLINIIQEEHLIGKKIQFDKWVQLDPSIASLFKDLCDHDLTIEKKPDDPKVIAFLDKLQRSLREINYKYQLRELKTECSRYSVVPSAADFAYQNEYYAIEDATLAVMDIALTCLKPAAVNQDDALARLADLLASGKYVKPLDRDALKLAISTINMAKQVATLEDTSNALKRALAKIEATIATQEAKDAERAQKPVYSPATKLDRLTFDLAILTADLARQVATQKGDKLIDVSKLINCKAQLKKLKEECSKYSLITDSSKFVDLDKALEEPSKKPPKQRAKAAAAAAPAQPEITLVAEAEALAQQASALAKQVIAQTKINNAKQFCYRGVTANSLYIEFISVYYHKNVRDLGYQVTALSGSKELQVIVDKVDRTKIQPEYEALVLVPLFLSLLYGENWAAAAITMQTEPEDTSPIIKCMSRAKEEFYWGLYHDLNCLAAALDVDLLHLESGEARYERKPHEALRHLVTVNNRGSRKGESGNHWTAVITFAEDLTTTDGKPVAPKPASPPLPAIKEGGKSPSPSSPKEGSAADALSARPTTKPKVVVAGAEGASSVATTTKPKVAVAGAEGALSVRTSPEREAAAKLALLITSVNRAVLNYLNYSDSIWFSLFHRHGSTGKTRARKFLADFSICDNYEKAQKTLVTFLKDNNDNGNTHPHSLKTMLLNETMFSCEKEKPRKDLADTSKNFEQITDSLIKKWGVAPKPPESENNSWWNWN